MACSALRARVIFVPAAGAFGVVSLNWRRLPEAIHHQVIIGGFAAYAAGLGWLAWQLRAGHPVGCAYALALIGAGMAAAFSPMMTQILMRVPVALAADATGMVVTVNQLAIAVGVASFGTVYLNLAGSLPAGPARPRPSRPSRRTRSRSPSWPPRRSAWPEA